jgi:GNAT superfamily N-acetyltransferase
MNDSYLTAEVSTDPAKLDVSFIHTFISSSYWAAGRTKDEVITCIRNSVNFGLYVNGKQVGYGRVVTDKVAFAYLMDVFIDPAYRGKGYGYLLVENILQDPELKAVRTWRLATSDAHELYAKFGFRPLEKPGNMMERKS